MDERGTAVGFVDARDGAATTLDAVWALATAATARTAVTKIIVDNSR